MEHNLTLYNSLTRKKEKFVPIHPEIVGMYVCGPTVYGPGHLGHARPAITFDILFRYLRHLGYKVRYVRNITDVGHLEHDADDGEDKVAKKARIEQLEPMEVVQMYLNSYHKDMEALNVPEDKNCVYLLNEMFDKDGVEDNNFKCLNLGISGNFFETTASNYEYIADKFKGSKYVVI